MGFRAFVRERGLRENKNYRIVGWQKGRFKVIGGERERERDCVCLSV